MFRVLSIILPLLVWAPSSVVGFQSTFPTRAAAVATTTRNTQLHVSSDDNKNKNLSASGQERRQEEKRRNARKNDAVPGKTSAIAGESDFSIDPTATQNQFMQSASNVDQEVFRQTELAMESLKMFQLEEAEAAFHRVFGLRPGAYCWQAGIVKYYLGDFVEAASIFSKSASIYESKFGAPASEERIWRDACEIKYWNSLSRKERAAVEESGGLSEVFPQAPEVALESDAGFETRKVLRITKDLFEASTKEVDDSNLVLSRAKLRSICDNTSGKRPTLDPKLWKITSCFYLGLHYDALGLEEESKECMKMALRFNSGSSNGNDIVHTLPVLHMIRRDWFDDDEMEERRTPKMETPTVLGVETDAVIVQSIQDSLSKMRFEALKTALKARGLKHTGSKDELQARLFCSLVEDAGLQL